MCPINKRTIHSSLPSMYLFLNLLSQFWGSLQAAGGPAARRPSRFIHMPVRETDWPAKNRRKLREPGARIGKTQALGGGMRALTRQRYHPGRRAVKWLGHVIESRPHVLVEPIDSALPC
jgi:hypothetical protein